MRGTYEIYVKTPTGRRVVCTPPAGGVCDTRGRVSFPKMDAAFVGRNAFSKKFDRHRYPIDRPARKSYTINIELRLHFSYVFVPHAYYAYSRYTRTRALAFYLLNNNEHDRITAYLRYVAISAVLTTQSVYGSNKLHELVRTINALQNTRVS